jgi:hypothetical protein
MPQSMIIPESWKAEADVQNFQVPPPQRGFRCDAPHTLIAIADIEPPLRNSNVTLDANGFNHDRMVRLLTGMRDNVSLPPILIEPGDKRSYRVRQGVYRYHASLALGFSHVPAEVFSYRIE